MNKHVPVVFTFDRRVLRPSAVALQSLMDAASPSTTYDIHVLHPDIADKYIAALQKMGASSRHSITFHQLSPRRFSGLPTNKGSWTEIVYYRFVIPEILPQYDRVIYSDMDVFFTGDLSSLMEIDMHDCPIGAVIGEINGPDMQCHNYFPENTKKHVHMSGFLLMDLKKMREDVLTQHLLETAARFADRLRMFDLDTLNLACPKMFSLPFTYCVLESIYAADDISQAGEFPWLNKVYSREELEAAKASPIIIHYAGALGKPWRRADVPPYYQAYLDRVPAVLCRRTLRDLRKYWVSKIFGSSKKANR